MSYEKHLSKRKSTSYCEFLIVLTDFISSFYKSIFDAAFVFIASYKALFIGSQSFDISGIED